MTLDKDLTIGVALRLVACAGCLACMSLLAAESPRPSAESITWSEVIDEIGSLRSLEAAVTTSWPDEERSPSRDVTSRLFFRRAGEIREEYGRSQPSGQASSDERIDRLVIARREGHRLERLFLWPLKREASRESRLRVGSVDTWEGCHLAGKVLNTLARLQRTDGGNVTRLGARSTGGRQVQGFEVPLAAFLSEVPDGYDVSGTLRVWADSGSAIPVTIEIVTGVSGSLTERVEVSFVRWNEPLSDHLFALDVPKGWKVRWGRSLVASAGAVPLRDGLSLRVALDADPDETVLDQGDISGLYLAQEWLDEARSRPTVRIALWLRQDAGMSFWERFGPTRSSESWFIATLDGTERILNNFGLLGDVFVWQDVSDLGLPLSEVVRRFFAGVPEGAFPEFPEGAPPRSGQREGSASGDSEAARTAFGIRLVSDEFRDGWRPYSGDQTHGQTVYLSPNPVVDETDVLDTWCEVDSWGQHYILVRLTLGAAQRFARMTGEHTGKRTAILLNGDVIAMLRIQTAITGGHVAILGSFTEEEACRMADSLAR